MQTLSNIKVVSYNSFSVPERLAGLIRLAYNFYWSWHSEVQELFVELNKVVWEKSKNPLLVLKEQKGYTEFLNNEKFLQKYDMIVKNFNEYIATKNEAWYAAEGDKEQELLKKGGVAYFCAEYGLHESFPIYSGGLGILAGDHCKEASDLGLPFCAVGLFYRRGFFTQMIDADGKQEHYFPFLDTETLPILQILDPETNEPIKIDLNFSSRVIKATAWLVQIGRIPLLLLDTGIEENAIEDRVITSQLYVSGRMMRIYQEIILGIGGVKLLNKLTIKPAKWHMNEGHSAFLLVERISQKMNEGKALDDVIAEIKKTNVFTIHTPVPAGNERFWVGNIRDLLKASLENSKFNIDDLLKLGLGVDKDPTMFDMTAFGLKLSDKRNGVSLLHGRTADKTWKKIVPSISGVTNGVHMPTWLGQEMQKLYTKYGANFLKNTQLDLKFEGEYNRGYWYNAYGINNDELWTSHKNQKYRLVEFARKKIREQYARHGASPEEMNELVGALNPDAFIIGFARRFATYKRASLIFSNEKRLLKLLNNKNKPVQIIFAGKAHPADKDGQKLIAKIYRQTRDEKYKGKVFFIEEYNMEAGRYLVQGADIWLNNPRRPLEASGTSGMKAAANGVPNVSILDGWWDEAYEFQKLNGWAIGDRNTNTNSDLQDKIDGVRLYDVLENEVISMYYDKDVDGVSKKWLEVMKNSVASSIFGFSTDRMLRDYLKEQYLSLLGN